MPRSGSNWRCSGPPFRELAGSPHLSRRTGINHPLVVRKAAPHAGLLGKRWGLLEVSNPNLIVTALKPGRDESLVLRLYEATGAAASAVRVKLPSGLTSVSEVNLIETI